MHAISPGLGFDLYLVPKETGSILRLREAVEVCRIPTTGPIVVHCRYVCVCVYVYVDVYANVYVCMCMHRCVCTENYIGLQSACL